MNVKEIKIFKRKVLDLKIIELKDSELFIELTELQTAINDTLNMINPWKKPLIIKERTK